MPHPRASRPGAIRTTSRLADAGFILLALGVMLAALPATAATDFIVWSSPNAGSGGGVTATVASNVVAGSFQSTVVGATEATFVADYGPSLSVLFYRSTAAGPASITSTLSFSPPLPTGARLLAIDLDAGAETFTLTSGGAPLAFVESRETTAGALSAFPSYDAGSGVLSTTAASPNDSEATVFDVSGLSTLDVDFSGGSLGSGSFIAIALPVQVPMLAPLGLFALVGGLLTVAGRGLTRHG